MKKFFKVVGIGAAAAVTKKLIDKNNNSGEDIVEDEEPEFEDEESDDSTENSTETTESTETNYLLKNPLAKSKKVCNFADFFDALFLVVAIIISERLERTQVLVLTTETTTK